MKRSIILVLLLPCSLLLFGQEDKNSDLLKTDSTWIKEYIKFPLSFARGIKYEGGEDIRFNAGWSDKDKPGFWSYVFVWDINEDKRISADTLQKHLESYFNGLMGIGEKEALSLQSTSVLLANDANVKSAQFSGKIKTLDAFFSKEPMILNVKVNQFFCEGEKRSFVLFRFSPKDFSHSIWEKLDGVGFHEGICELMK